VKKSAPQRKSWLRLYLERRWLSSESGVVRLTQLWELSIIISPRRTMVKFAKLWLTQPSFVLLASYVRKHFFCKRVVIVNNLECNIIDFSSIKRFKTSLWSCDLNIYTRFQFSFVYMLLFGLMFTSGILNIVLLFVSMSVASAGPLLLFQILKNNKINTGAQWNTRGSWIVSCRNPLPVISKRAKDSRVYFQFVNPYDSAADC